MIRRTSMILLLWLAPWTAWAHGGDDHLHGAREPLPDPAGEVESASFTGESYEVVAKRVGRTLRLYLADARSNDPLSGAELKVVLVGEREETVRAAPAPTPGVYEVSLGSDAPLELVALVERWGVAEVLPLGRLGSPEAHADEEAHASGEDHHDRAAREAHADEAHHEHGPPGWFLGFLGLLAGLGAGVLLRRRSDA